MKKLILTWVFLFLAYSPVFADKPLPAEKPLSIGAHAHNDYEHEFPLWDALHNGFSSVETDVHLQDGEFYVAHDEEEIQKDRTVRSLYLDPLMKLVRENRGSVYADGSGIILLIDVKTEAPGTWPALKAVLMEYRELFSFYRNGVIEKGPVTAVVSGNRDWEAMAAEKICPALYDGRIEDLAANPESCLIPIISSSWTDEFSWDGQGEIPDSDLLKMKMIVEKAHAQERKVRFWGTDVPDAVVQEKVWDLLINAGADYINTDKLEEFRAHLGRR